MIVRRMRLTTPVMVCPARQWLGCLPAVNARRACDSGSVAPWIYKSEGEGEVNLYLNT
jgi:hypothetical protein